MCSEWSRDLGHLAAEEGVLLGVSEEDGDRRGRSCPTGPPSAGPVCVAWLEVARHAGGLVVVDQGARRRGRRRTMASWASALGVADADGVLVGWQKLGHAPGSGRGGMMVTLWTGWASGSNQATRAYGRPRGRRCIRLTLSVMNSSRLQPHHDLVAGGVGKSIMSTLSLSSRGSPAGRPRSRGWPGRRRSCPTVPHGRSRRGNDRVVAARGMVREWTLRGSRAGPSWVGRSTVT